MPITLWLDIKNLKGKLLMALLTCKNCNHMPVYVARLVLETIMHGVLIEHALLQGARSL
jgi:hypothetical protein